MSMGAQLRHLSPRAKGLNPKPLKCKQGSLLDTRTGRVDISLERMGHGLLCKVFVAREAGTLLSSLWSALRTELHAGRHGLPSNVTAI